MHNKELTAKSLGLHPADVLTDLVNQEPDRKVPDSVVSLRAVKRLKRQRAGTTIGKPGPKGLPEWANNFKLSVMVIEGVKPSEGNTELTDEDIQRAFLTKFDRKRTLKEIFGVRDGFFLKEAGRVNRHTLGAELGKQLITAQFDQWFSYDGISAPMLKGLLTVVMEVTKNKSGTFRVKVVAISAHIRPGTPEPGVADSPCSDEVAIERALANTKLNNPVLLGPPELKWSEYQEKGSTYCKIGLLKVVPVGGTNAKGLSDEVYAYVDTKTTEVVHEQSFKLRCWDAEQLKEIAAAAAQRAEEETNESKTLSFPAVPVGETMADFEKFLVPYTMPGVANTVKELKTNQVEIYYGSDKDKKLHILTAKLGPDGKWSFLYHLSEDQGAGAAMAQTFLWHEAVLRTFNVPGFPGVLRLEIASFNEDDNGHFSTRGSKTNWEIVIGRGVDVLAALMFLDLGVMFHEGWHSVIQRLVGMYRSGPHEAKADVGNALALRRRLADLGKLDYDVIKNDRLSVGELAGKPLPQGEYNRKGELRNIAGVMGDGKTKLPVNPNTGDSHKDELPLAAALMEFFDFLSDGRAGFSAAEGNDRAIACHVFTIAQDPGMSTRRVHSLRGVLAWLDSALGGKFKKEAKQFFANWKITEANMGSENDIDRMIESSKRYKAREADRRRSLRSAS
jgi:hypothetical protein